MHLDPSAGRATLSREVPHVPTRPFWKYSFFGSPFWKYFLVGSAFWFGVDFSTAFAPNVSRWVSYMPTILVFYFGAPLALAYLIYRRRWSDRRLVAPMLAVLFIVEVVFSHNALLYTFPLFFVFIPVAVALYAFLTFVPRWIVDGRLADHRRTTALLAVIWIVIAALSTGSRIAGGP